MNPINLSNNNGRGQQEAHTRCRSGYVQKQLHFLGGSTSRNLGIP